MTWITLAFHRLVADRRGISAVEYAILIGVVGVGLVGVLNTVGGNLETYVTNQFTLLVGADGSGPPAPAPE